MCLQGYDIALLFTKAARGQSRHRRVAPALGRGNHPRPSLRQLRQGHVASSARLGLSQAPQTSHAPILTGTLWD